MSQTLVAVLGFLGGGVAAVVDGRLAIRVAALLGGAALTAAAAGVSGAPGALVPLLAGAAPLATEPVARRCGSRVGRAGGLVPDIPVIGPRDALFGPRSVRVAAAALALPAASWVSLNVPVGGAASAGGAIFAAAYLWLAGAIRLLRARSLEDLAVGSEAVALSASVAWILETGTQGIPEAAAVAALAPLVAGVAGWLDGRHRRPDSEIEAAAA